jgi:choline dehydrogenase
MHRSAVNDAEETFDYCVIGAGSAGCLLANRLSADGRHRVLLLEAGGRDDWIWFHIPVGYIYSLGDPRADWCFKTEPEPRLGGRSILVPRGKVIGGSSGINAMIYIRGQAADYDHWRQLGLVGWGWDDVLPFFMRHEDFVGGSGPHHGAGGELRVDVPRLSWPLLDRVREAAVETGLRWIGDFNEGDNEGVAPLHVNQKKGWRWGAAKAFLKPALQRKNLKLETDAHVEQVLTRGRRAVGVRYRKAGKASEARIDGEVILSAGAIGSPQLLMLSGIGPAAHLAEHGIDVVLDKPGVGQNLHDHLMIPLRYRVSGIGTLNERFNSRLGRIAMGLEYALRRRGPLTMAPSQLGIFCRASPDSATADLGYNVIPYTRSSTAARVLDKDPGLTMAVYDLRPTSRGELRLKGPDPATAPSIFFNYLATDRDRRVAANAVRKTRAIMSQAALKPYRPTEIVPGPSVGHDDGELLEAIGRIATTIFHPVGSARMGLTSDALAVVDARLKVIGIEGLRVIDASVMPTVTSGNTNAPTMMIAEKGAALLRDDAFSRG